LRTRNNRLKTHVAKHVLAQGLHKLVVCLETRGSALLVRPEHHTHVLRLGNGRPWQLAVPNMRVVPVHLCHSGHRVIIVQLDNVTRTKSTVLSKALSLIFKSSLFRIGRQRPMQIEVLEFNQNAQVTSGGFDVVDACRVCKIVVRESGRVESTLIASLVVFGELEMTRCLHLVLCDHFGTSDTKIYVQYCG